MITLEKIKNTMLTKQYAWFEDGDYNLNIVGVRNSQPGTRVTNVFDDWITMSYRVNNQWHFHAWEATTDPGTKAVKEFRNSRGVAILVPGQYRSSYIIGPHAGKYEALRQDRPVKVFRDKNRDMKFDMDPKTIQEGTFGINIHRSNPKTQSNFVENWSEGCQVFRKVRDFNEFMRLCNIAKGIHGNRFTYTLLESKDII